MTPLDSFRGVNPHWASAGIVDARAFTVGASDLVHQPSHAEANRIRGLCGVVARIVEYDGPLASWANSFPTCRTCIARGARTERSKRCSCGCGAGA